ncbi:DMT family transporter [Thalassomonas actiniarum]|uniref:DMT family transporter n=1 Tax=Thalassomonas actiniarum TaxID=485447 RepID=A0AAF0C2R6_9GAMM|nr:DMT family transporter [Thalassomonas actiniarum]WDD98797.1 DMT family transporter [Thalassomonas actiniarum]
MKSLFILIACGFIWGSQYIFNAAALAEVDALWIAASRSTIGAIFLIVVCRLLKLERSPGNWPLIALIGLLEATVPFLLVAWGQQTTPPAFAAVITGTNPLITLLLAPLVLAGTRMTAKAVVCSLIGFGGLLYLFWPQLQQQGLTEFAGSFAILFAAASFALSLLLVKRLEHLHPIVLARDVIAVSALQLIPMALIWGTVPVEMPSLTSVGSVLYLGVFCGGLVYVLFMTLIMDKGPTFASFSNYLVPTVGVLLSMLVTDVALDNRIFISLLIIIGSIYLYQLDFSFNSKSAKSTANGLGELQEEK